jgi:hypothetical protein
LPIELLSIEVLALPAQIPDKDPDAQQQDYQQGYRQGCRLPMDPAPQEETQCAQDSNHEYPER